MTRTEELEELIRNLAISEARLKTQTSDLLEALKALLEFRQNPYSGEFVGANPMEVARHAIAKAEAQ